MSRGQTRPTMAEAEQAADVFPEPHSYLKPVMTTATAAPCETCGREPDAACHRPEGRCTQRKHVKENDRTLCDCQALTVGVTAAGNARVVTLLRANVGVS